MQPQRVIGLMSGSSLDGLDIAYCHFTQQNGQWQFELLQADTLPYTDEWVQGLKHLPIANARTLCETHAALGHYFGRLVQQFIQRHGLQGKVDLVASHGHTIFHFPHKGFTTQIADGAAIAHQTGLPVVCDFRTADIAAGGQGTPIVPIGDQLLFAQYPYCLNIGGIANISAKVNGKIVAFDICAANQVLNLFAAKLGMEYDANGAAAADGTVHAGVLQKLNEIEYYGGAYPKSLDNSFTREVVLPCFDDADISPNDKLRTYCEHIALQIAAHLQQIAATEKSPVQPGQAMLVTGGGAFNAFLISRIRALAGVQVVLPAAEIISFKEALVIAFMGVLRMQGLPNVLSTVTGARHNTIGGAVYG